MKLASFKGFTGQHCETTTVGSLLTQLDIHLSEPMLFGLGQGLGFIFWKMKSMDFPFIGGRIKTDLLTENICRNLALQLEVQETSSPKKAWALVEQHLSKGKAVGLKLDCYHLEYFTAKIHFAGHYVTLYGYDEQNAFLIDTLQQGGRVSTSLASLASARNERGPMSSRNRTFVIHKTENEYDPATAVRHAIHANALDFRSPPITNLTYKGILKTSKAIIKWFERSEDIKRDFQTTAMLMERAGTGGSLFRNLYRDFLFESAALLKSKDVESVAEEFIQIANRWKEVSELFYEAGEQADIKYIHLASERLVELSKMEYEAMGRLLDIDY